MTDHLNSTDDENLPSQIDIADTAEEREVIKNIVAEAEDLYLAMANELKDLCRDELGVDVDLNFLIKGIKLRGLLYSRFLALLGIYGDDFEKLKRHGFRYSMKVEAGKDILHLVVYRSPEHVCTIKNRVAKTDTGFSSEILSSEVRMQIRLENGGTEMVSIETYDNTPHIQKIPKILYLESFEV